jgi:hypothetical protein
MVGSQVRSLILILMGVMGACFIVVVGSFKC